MAIAKSLLIFVLAGLCEIGGGYLVWLWIKEDKPVWFGISGMIILVLYGVVATLQPSNFGRVDAAYGGIFVVMSLLWSFKVDNFIPDKFDIIGAAIVLLGTWFIFLPLVTDFIQHLLSYHRTRFVDRFLQLDKGQMTNC